MTPFSRLAVFFEFLQRIGYREAVRQHMPFSQFSEGHRHGKDVHGVFTLGGSGSAALRIRQFAARRRRLARTTARSDLTVEPRVLPR